MKFPSLTILIVVAAIGDLEGQIPRTVLQVQAMAVRAESNFWGVGLGIWRRSPGRVAYGVAAIPGTSNDTFTFRAEGAVIFHLDPGRQSGIAPYGGGGAIWRRRDGDSEGFLLVLLGLESSPAAASGWFAEVGVGAGLRGSFGWRIRR